MNTAYEDGYEAYYAGVGPPAHASIEWLTDWWRGWAAASEREEWRLDQAAEHAYEEACADADE
jgi:hypothetical protein